MSSCVSVCVCVLNSTRTSSCFSCARLPQPPYLQPPTVLDVQLCSLKSQTFDSLGAETEAGRGPFIIGVFPSVNTPMWKPFLVFVSAKHTQFIG